MCTDNLRTELLHFLGEYSRRAEAREHNTWIVKPWNLARGIGHVISTEQACILRQLETGPRVASLYVPNPLLYNRRKVDFRCGFLTINVVLYHRVLLLLYLPV